MQLFRDSYGDDYRGDRKLLKKIGEADRIIGLYNTDRRMGAAAIIGAGRILAPGTSPNYEVFGSRSRLMVQLLQESNRSGDAEWVSIGVEYDKMQNAATRADMHPTQNAGRIDKLLEAASELGVYRLGVSDDHGLIIEKDLPNNDTYRQQVWVYG